MSEDRQQDDKKKNDEKKYNGSQNVHGWVKITRIRAKPGDDSVHFVRRHAFINRRRVDPQRV